MAAKKRKIGQGGLSPAQRKAMMDKINAMTPEQRKGLFPTQGQIDKALPKPAGSGDTLEELRAKRDRAQDAGKDDVADMFRAEIRAVKSERNKAQSNAKGGKVKVAVRDRPENAIARLQKELEGLPSGNSNRTPEQQATAKRLKASIANLRKEKESGKKKAKLPASVSNVQAAKARKVDPFPGGSEEDREAWLHTAEYDEDGTPLNAAAQALDDEDQEFQNKIDRDPAFRAKVSAQNKKMGMGPAPTTPKSNIGRMTGKVGSGKGWRYQRRDPRTGRWV